METIQANTLLIGNPGTGKSTILNGLLQRQAFESGVSLGKGLTSVCQVERDSMGNVYIDTPGLSDVFMREKAAQEISKALRTGGIFKIFFVITLEAGRIRGDDKTTIRLVTQAAPIGSRYSIIVNKLEPEIIELLKEPQQKAGFIAMLNEGLPGATAIHFNQIDPELSAKKNKVPILSPELLTFINCAPSLLIPPEQVKQVRPNEFDEIKETFDKELRALREDKVLLEQKIQEQSKKYEEIVRQNEEQQKKLETQFAAQMNQMKQHYDKLIEEAKKKSTKRGFSISLGPLSFKF